MALVVPTERPSSVRTDSVEPPPTEIFVLASVPVRTSLCVVASTAAVTLVVALCALIVAAIVAALSPAVIVNVVPLISSVPPADDSAVKSAEPVSLAAASGSSVAP